jgi:hypothetical protein
MNETNKYTIIMKIGNFYTIWDVDIAAENHKQALEFEKSIDEASEYIVIEQTSSGGLRNSIKTFKRVDKPTFEQIQ